jgi:uncharacterized protein
MSNPTNPPADVVELRAAMRDGVRLATNVRLPAGDGPFPVVLTRTPYSKGAEDHNAPDPYTPHGYAWVSQDCRGTGDSDGAWEPFANDRDDGLDTQAWVLDQAWCDGTICTTGGSYLGYTQWIVAPGAARHHKAMFTTVPLTDWYHDCSYTGGAFGLGLLVAWGSMMAEPSASKADPVDWTAWDWNAAYRHLPLSTWDDVAGVKIPHIREWVGRPTFDDYWGQKGIAHRLEDIDTPAVTVAGWYDVFANHAVRTVAGLRELGREDQHLIIGPWGHDVAAAATGRDFGPNAGAEAFAGIELAWFDHFAKGKPKPELPPYRLFVMGANEWRDETEWPLARTTYTPYYLGGDGSGRLGGLQPDLPGAEEPDAYSYDPDHPVPTRGGSVLFDTPIGSHDQTGLEARDDVLVYTTAPLDRAVEVTGPVKVVLYAASDAPDTDWTAKLIDVYPDGAAYNLCDGIVRARYRDAEAAAELIEPGRVYRYKIDCWVTSNVFLPGHSIRLHISSSNFPRFDRNPNTGHAFGDDAELAIARQTVYHDAERASHVLLPIIPADG